MWSTFAFAGAYQWTLIPLIALAAWLALVERPRVAGPSTKAMDLLVVAGLVAVALQIVPLPAGVVRALSPAAPAYDRLMRVDVPGTPPPAARPLSIDPASGAWSLAVALGLALLFWSARATVARGGVRTVVRTVGGAGLVLSAIAIVQHATAPTRIYWYFRPEASSARPYGPFVNRNDLACWLVLAIPLTIGYLVARVRSRRRGDTTDPASIVDPTFVWLAASVSLMLGALLVTQSRSGITAGVCALALFAWMARRHGRGARGWILVGILAIAAVATTYASLGALASRAGDTLTEGIGGRRAIWRESWVMAKDFWLTGVGAGAYERGMLVYQTSPRQFFYFNHAHNEYLQMFAEGGLLLVLPLAGLLTAGAAGVARSLRRDQSAMYWIRAGAASGLLAVAVQSVWETGLQLPANAVLFAVVFAIALHDSSG